MRGQYACMHTEYVTFTFHTLMHELFFTIGPYFIKQHPLSHRAADCLQVASIYTLCVGLQTGRENQSIRQTLRKSGLMSGSMLMDVSEHAHGT